MPKPIQDAVLSRFTWDRENEYWLGTFDVAPGVPTWLTVQVGPSEGTAVLALARLLGGRSAARQDVRPKDKQKTFAKWRTFTENV